jgi:hypothetical protein
MCGDPAGVCVGATCATGDDCGAGQECTSWDSSLGCLYLAFACTTPVDTCGGDADCDFSPNYFCGLQPDGHRECMPGGCAIGRPFLVDGDARTAPLATRADWLAELATPTPALDGLPPELRARLARAWERTAKMEHASIAAFARFSLQLLALGAPAELVERTNAAMVDETRHARVAYALASAYGGAPVGPGPLAIDGALASASLADVVRLVVREGCIGETVAAIEAGEAAARATDPVVRSVLETIARDEASHAELAWRFIAWALRTKDAAACAVIHDEIALLRASSEHGALGSLASLAADDERMLDHGIATDGARAIIRGHALRSIVMPCLGALIDEATAPRRYDEGAVVSSRAPV